MRHGSSTPFAFVLVNLTTSATPTNLSPTPAFLAGLCDALEEQTMGPFAQAHGQRVTAFRVGSNATDRGPNEINPKSKHVQDCRVPSRTGRSTVAHLWCLWCFSSADDRASLTCASRCNRRFHTHQPVLHDRWCRRGDGVPVVVAAGKLVHRSRKRVHVRKRL
jgi:hypothetical protein